MSREQNTHKKGGAGKMPKKFDLEQAAEFEITGALAVGHGRRRRSRSASKGSVRLSRMETQQVFDAAYGIASLIDRVPRRSILTPSGHSLRLEKKKNGGGRTLRIHLKD
jgi:hypothetical protein